MYEVTKELNFCAAHRLYPYTGCCSNLHGHNYRVEVTIQTEVLKEGMVKDFHTFQPLQDWINKYWDHHLLLSRNDPLLSILKDTKIYIIDGSPTAENMAKELSEACPLPLTKITIWETSKCQATYIK